MGVDFVLSSWVQLPQQQGNVPGWGEKARQRDRSVLADEGSGKCHLAGLGGVERGHEQGMSTAPGTWKM